MERQNILLGISVLFFASALSFVVGLEVFGVEDRELYSSQPNVTLDDDNYEEEISFDNRTANFYYESWGPQLFIDPGEPYGERTVQLEDDGEQHHDSHVITKGKDSYRFSFRYVMDSEDSYVTIYEINQLG